jgi:acetoin:2,6-dichlorophenolindophenol oxidoreductase subunit beta
MQQQQQEIADTKEITYREAITEALYEEMERDPRVFLMGEDLRVFFGGGPLGVTPSEKFLKKFGPERVRDTPISEASFVGAGVGAAITGLKPVVELMFVDFAGVCFDQLTNNAGKLHYIMGGQYNVPLVVRTTIGAGASFAAVHSMANYSLFAHSPGLKIVVPSTAADAKGLLKTAIRDQDPVIFFEHRGLYSTKGQIPTEEYTIPFGVADVKQKGRDVTIVAISAMVHRALEAAELLQKQDNISAEVLDPRTLVPLDEKAILDSVAKTSRLVVVDEDYERCGMGAEIASLVAGKGFGSLKAPVKIVATPTVPIPYSKELERTILPDAAKISTAVREVVSYRA